MPSAWAGRESTPLAQNEIQEEGHMRKVMSVVLGLGVLTWTAAAVHAQGALGGLGDAAKQGASDAVKQKVDDTLGVQGATDKAANPNAATKQAADDATNNANGAAAGAAQGAVGNAAGGMKEAPQPAADGDDAQ